MKEQIVELVTTCIASVGGVGVLITLLCTIIKTFGGNSVKAKLANAKIDTDKTLEHGLNEISKTVESKINTDITVDITSRVEGAVKKQLDEQQEINVNLLENINKMRIAISDLLAIEGEQRAISAEKRKLILERAKEMAEIKAVERIEKPVAHITLKESEPTSHESVKEPEKSVKRTTI